MSIAQAYKRIIRRMSAGDIMIARMRETAPGSLEVQEAWSQIGGKGPLTPLPLKTVQAMVEDGAVHCEERLPDDGKSGVLYRLSLAENAPQSTQDEAESLSSLPDEALHIPLFKASEKPPMMLEGHFNCLILIPAGTYIRWTSPSLTSGEPPEVWETPEDLQALADWVPGQKDLLCYYERSSAPHTKAYVGKHLVQFLKLPSCSICKSPAHQVLKGRYCCNRDACKSQVNFLDSMEHLKDSLAANEPVGGPGRPVDALVAILPDVRLKLQLKPDPGLSIKLPGAKSQSGRGALLWQVWLSENDCYVYLTPEEVKVLSEEPRCQACQEQRARQVYQGYLACLQPSCKDHLKQRALYNQDDLPIESLEEELPSPAQEPEQKSQEPASEYHEMIAEMYPDRYQKAEPDPALAIWSSEVQGLLSQLEQRMAGAKKLRQDKDHYPSWVSRAPYVGEDEALTAAWVLLKQHLLYAAQPSPAQALREYQDYLRGEKAKYESIGKTGQEVFQSMLETLAKGEQAAQKAQPPAEEQQHAS